VLSSKALSESGVKFERVWRPTLRQACMPGRLMNAGWMIARWSFVAFNLERQPDVVVIGTDPVLSILVALVWRTFRPERKLSRVFDLYPEAAYAQGVLRPSSVWAGLLRRVLIRAYASCDLIVDIGSCMRSLLNSYGRQPCTQLWSRGRCTSQPRFLRRDRPSAQ